MNNFTGGRQVLATSFFAMRQGAEARRQCLRTCTCTCRSVLALGSVGQFFRVKTGRTEQIVVASVAWAADWRLFRRRVIFCWGRERVSECTTFFGEKEGWDSARRFRGEVLERTRLCESTAVVG